MHFVVGLIEWDDRQIYSFLGIMGSYGQLYMYLTLETILSNSTIGCYLPRGLYLACPAQRG